LDFIFFVFLAQLYISVIFYFVFHYIISKAAIRIDINLLLFLSGNQKWTLLDCKSCCWIFSSSIFSRSTRKWIQQRQHEL